VKPGQYLFRKHGGKVVFFGCFIAVLRALAAVLAGTNRMSWAPFLLYNALGGIIRATLYATSAAWRRLSTRFLVHLMRPSLSAELLRII
jgi:membrane protein DedA with SNARE-associated domain